jgi:hypothetical protein
VLAGILAAPALAGTIGRREARQRARIHQGVHGGALTAGEAKVLRHEQRHIESLRQRALADGHIGRREGAALDRAQDRASRDIYRLKHNGREAAGAH